MKILKQIMVSIQNKETNEWYFEPRDVVYENGDFVVNLNYDADHEIYYSVSHFSSGWCAIPGGNKNGWYAVDDAIEWCDLIASFTNKGDLYQEGDQWKYTPELLAKVKAAWVNF